MCCAFKPGGGEGISARNGSGVGSVHFEEPVEVNEGFEKLRNEEFLDIGVTTPISQPVVSVTAHL